MSKAITIKSNYQPRPILCGWELPNNQRKTFDYLDDGEFEYHSFFKYKWQYYDLNEFVRIKPDRNNAHNNVEFNSWHSVQCDSYFSGILIRYCDDYEGVIVGCYYA